MLITIAFFTTPYGQPVPFNAQKNGEHARKEITQTKLEPRPKIKIEAAGITT